MFEFIVPLVPSSRPDERTVAEYVPRLAAGERRVALAVAVLEVKQPATWRGQPAITEHWCLAHYFLDGHHKMLDAARTGQTVTLLSFLAIDQSIANGAGIERALAAPARPQRAAAAGAAGEPRPS